MSTSATDDAIARAAEAVSEEHYRGSDGQAARHTTDTAVILRRLRLLDLQPGQRVLEIGTGSGMSSALLAELTGSEGRVVSVDILANLTERAARLHAEAGYTTVTTLARDGLSGAPEYAPFDRIIAWTSPPRLPDTWLAQTAPGAVILHPLPTARLVYSTALLRCVVDAEGVPIKPSVHRADCVRMDAPYREAAETDAADAATEQGYVSAEWLHGRGGTLARDILSGLLEAPHSEDTYLTWPECDHLRPWLIARRPHRLISAGRGNEIGYGLVDGDKGEHVALFVLLPRPRLVADSAHSPALHRLRALIDEWHADGQPATDTHTPELHRIEEGWRISL
ncbi:protein-L-isoaspartate O-methyltransferase family protein [Salinactinospora qingdaonensis]|uniref:Protein-L-isoaspartate O-methyltransferase n=1 Tax=Salinactinospora qingdaonensis TaxID=702744 RepID=A0ABP7FW11_9ACTN